MGGVRPSCEDEVVSSPQPDPDQVPAVEEPTGRTRGPLARLAAGFDDPVLRAVVNAHPGAPSLLLRTP